MRKAAKTAIVALTLLFGAGDIELDGQLVSIGVFKLTSGAEARVGRPMTPVSVAGVARRTPRRPIRRGAAIGVLPAGCPYGSYYGYNLYYCGGTYYQQSGGGYIIVYF